MTFIDWSDPEGMFGLLLDFVADERVECQQDPERQHFLSDLFAQLETMEARFAEVSAAIVIQGLRDIHDAVGAEFAGDPVMVHLKDCVDELEREGRQRMENTKNGVTRS